MKPLPAYRATVSIDALLHNVSVIRSFIPDTVDIIAVVKDSSYGCGSVAIAKALTGHANINHFAVATLHEAYTLRHSGIDRDILILGKVSPSEIEQTREYNFTYTLCDTDDLIAWKEFTFPLSFHIEIDTGMRRMGVAPESMASLVPTLLSHPHLQLSGLFTHMACADVPATTSVENQLAQFSTVIALLNSHGIYPRCTHTANSAAIMRYPSGLFTHVRPGIALYGCQPDPAQCFSTELQPIITLASRVTALRTVPSGTAVSYGGHYITSRDTVIATIGIGYAQGVPRYLSNCGSILINGKRYTIAGNVTMDYCMVDAGLSTSVTIGDEAVVLGQQGKETITPDDIAILGSTIGYEVLCNIGSNVPHTYLYKGTPIHTTDANVY